MKRADKILIVILIVLAAVFIVYQYVGKKEGNTVVITVSGKQIEELQLDENKELEIKTENNGYNVVMIKDGKVSMKEANCKNQICVKKGEISQVGESIVCLPHKVIVKIIDKKQK